MRQDSGLWGGSDYMDDEYHSPRTKQQLLDKQQRDIKLREKFPLEFNQQLTQDSSNQEIK